jgi:hypothetical protein
VKKYLKLNDFANSIGASRQAIYKAYRAGTFPVVEIEGVLHIDPNNKLVVDYKAIITSKKTARPGHVSAPKKRTKTLKRQSSGKKKKTSRLGKTTSVLNQADIPEYLKRIADSSALSFQQMTALSKPEVDKIKIYEQIKQIRVKTQRDRHELISRKLVRVVFGKLHEIDMNEFLAIKTRVVPELSKIFQCTDADKLLEAEKKIDEELWEVLHHVKHETDKFLNQIGADENAEV